MKTLNLLFIIIFLNVLTLQINAQTVYDFKVKDNFNTKNRTQILNLLRGTMLKEFKEKYVFTVNKFNMCGNYAWFMGNAERADGKPVNFDTKDGDYDCCHVEALFQKVKGVWYIVEKGAFSTDVWYDGICERHKAPCQIYN